MDLLVIGLVFEQILIYGGAILLCGVVIFIYLYLQRKQSKRVGEKIEQAKRDGLFEPVSLHPVVDPNTCIKTGACIAACPEEDILGIRHGKATIINASRCVGHGACFHACPTEAISLHIGTEKRGVDLPHVNRYFESNVPGIYIAGELGGMGLIKNSVEQGRQAVENISKTLIKDQQTDYDLIIVGAGPAGIAATLTAKKNNLKTITLEQESLGGTVYTFPRSKIVMTSTMELPLYKKVKLFETSKSELLGLWQDVLSENNLQVKENTKVESIGKENGHFLVTTQQGDQMTTQKVLLAIGRRGTPRKLGVPGENTEKVAYRLLEPENISDKKILVVGGGDSAIEAALLLCTQNHVTLSYRKDIFSRIKPANSQKIIKAIDLGTVEARFNTDLLLIEKDTVTLSDSLSKESTILKNDLVYIFAGGELPTQFLEKVGIKITKKFGEAILKH